MKDFSLQLKIRIIFFVLLILSVTVLADEVVTSPEIVENKVVEFGLYEAFDTEVGDVKATILLREDGSVNFSLMTADFQLPEPGCVGNFTVVANDLKAELVCPLEGLEQVQVSINISSITPESIRSTDGAIVAVKIDLLGEEAVEFRLKIIEPAVVVSP